MGITIIQKSDLTVRKRDAKVALVLAGGAMTGGAFKLGGLKALDDFLINRKVTDFDGSALGEKQLAARYGVRFTPTIQFFPDTAEGLTAKPAEQREVARMAGYYRPEDFLAMFRYVQEKAYEKRSFREFLKGYRS